MIRARRGRRFGGGARRGPPCGRSHDDRESVLATYIDVLPSDDAIAGFCDVGLSSKNCAGSNSEEEDGTGSSFTSSAASSSSADVEENSPSADGLVTTRELFLTTVVMPLGIEAADFADVSISKAAKQGVALPTFGRILSQAVPHYPEQVYKVFSR